MDKNRNKPRLIYASWATAIKSILSREPILISIFGRHYYTKAINTAYKKTDAVFEGGGVRGIGLVGAVVETEAQGYRFENVAGTSAGAIVAALLAAGYTGLELQKLLMALDYKKFEDSTLLDKIPFIGQPLEILLQKGIYPGDYFENWLRKLLAAKGVKTFADLILPGHSADSPYRYKLRVIASDISRRKLLILPQDSVDYGIVPETLSVATQYG